MATIERRKLKTGDVRYDVRYWLPGGDRQQRKMFKKLADAEKWKRRVEHDEMLGIVADHRAGAETFGPYAVRWIESRVVSGRPLSPASKQGYRALLRRNLLPHFETMPLRQIRPATVRTWHSAVTVDKGGDQAAKTYRLLRAILNTAVDDEVLVANPCRIRGGGSENAAERPMIPTEMLLDLADAIDPRYRALVLLSGIAALRTGELLGLRRCDVDLLHRRLHIVQQAQEVTGVGRIVVRPKSDAGRRQVIIPALLVEPLEEHLAAYAEPGPDGVVFTGPEWTPLRRATLSKAWAAARTSAGAPAGLHLHDCRHHAATRLAQVPGITLKELMVAIGHSTPRAALIYQHATEDRARDAADWLGTQLDAVQRSRTAPVSDLSCHPRATEGPAGEPQIGSHPA
ncbi:MAG: site-specific integrase [Acidimicrobiales bacterium]